MPIASSPLDTLAHDLTSSPYDAPLISKSLRTFIKSAHSTTTAPKQHDTPPSYTQLILVAQIHASNYIITHLTLRTLKILMRMQVFRSCVREDLIAFIRRVMHVSLIRFIRGDSADANESNAMHASTDTVQIHTDILIECANVVLNVCFEAYNVRQVTRFGTHSLNEGELWDTRPDAGGGKAHTNGSKGQSTTAASEAPSIIALMMHALRVTKSHPSVQGAMTGAIQSICVTQDGKDAVIACDGVRVLSEVLLSSAQKASESSLSEQHTSLTTNISQQQRNILRTRIIGALHNLSTDYFIALKLRDTGIIPHLIEVLKEEACVESNVSDDGGDDKTRTQSILTPSTTTPTVQQSTLVASCAGCIQNLSREDKARQMIRENGGVEPLVALLFSQDTFVQKCAAAALLNIVGTEISDLPDHPMRKAFKEILSSAIAVGGIVDVFSVNDGGGEKGKK